MIELELADLYEAAARATINERCAPAYLHDIRGSMQALFSALELLGRSAKSGCANPERVELACALARRAINHHEKSTLEALQILTLQRADSVTFDFGALVAEVVHFLRNDAGNRDILISVAETVGFSVLAERAKLRTLLVGLLTAAIDTMPPGSTLTLSVYQRDGDAIVFIGSNAGYETHETRDWCRPPHGLAANELTLWFAHRYLRANGGRLEIDATAAPRGALHLHYPIAAA